MVQERIHAASAGFRVPHEGAEDYDSNRCRRRAEAAKDEIGKATWITFAKEWLKLGDEAEQSTGATGRRGPEVGGPACPQPGKVGRAGGPPGLGIRGTPWLLE
jgi:hypothetical protein